MKRAVLAPGLRVIQRSRNELQIGLGRDLRLRVPATEPVRRTLTQLLRGEALPDDPSTRATLNLLAPVLAEGAGLVVAGVEPGDVAALALRTPSYSTLVDRRARATVAICGALEVPAGDPRPLLGAAGLRVASALDAASVAVVLCAGEIDRGDLDLLLRSCTPHLLVRLVEGTALVGPFVDPGRTACLRCIDAHSALDDPEAPVLAVRHALAQDDRRDGVVEPVDNALAALAVAWAVRDVLTHVEGERPATWSAVVRLSPTLADVTQTEWLRHPGCGCAWLPDAQPSRTMEA